MRISDFLGSFVLTMSEFFSRIIYDHVRNEEVLLRVKEQRNILHEISKRKANWIGHICVETAFYNGLLKER